MFNDVDTKKFVCLLDYRACHPAITLSSVDVAILLNSDCNPSNGVKALHKITIDSRERVRVLRLYSSFTIEEKALILSKQGTILDSDTDRISYNTCHQLLAWGASYLFSKLSKDSSSKSETCLIDDLVHDLSSLLMNKNGNTNRLKSSIVSKAQFHEGVYSKNLSLSGEIEAHTKESSLIDDYLMEKGPLVFWTNLFKESPWKNSCSRLSRARRVQKSFRDPSYWFEELAAENDSNMKNSPNDATNVKTKLRRKRKLLTEVEESTNNVAECTNNQPSQSQPQTLLATPPVCDEFSITKPLETEVENIKKEQEEVTKLHQEKKSMLVSECEKEMLEIQKKYDAIMEESEMCLTKKMKVLEEYYDLVYANKVLAETLAKACDDNLEKIEKETNSVRILEIPASALVQSKNQCTIRIPTGQILRDPAPHLRSSSSLFTSFPTPSTTQTRTELNNIIDQENTEKLPLLQSSHSSCGI